VRFCQTNKNEAPLGKKKRKVTKNKQYSKEAKRIESHTDDENYYSDALTKKYKYQVFRQGIKPYWAYTDERSAKNEQGTLIKHQGALRNSWAGMIANVSRKRKGQWVGNSKTEKKSGVLRAISSEVRKGRDDAETTMHNSISYIFDVTPHADSVGLNGAAKDIEKQLGKTEEEMKGTWNK